MSHRLMLMAGGALVLLAGCTLAFDFAGFSKGTVEVENGGEAVQGQGGGGGVATCQSDAKVLRPREGVYHYRASTECPCYSPNQCDCAPEDAETCSGHGFELTLSGGGSLKLCQPQVDLVDGIVRHFDHPGYPACWSFSMVLFQGQLWAFEMWLCATEDGRLVKLFEKNLQTWNVGMDVQTTTTIDCRTACDSSLQPSQLLRPEAASCCSGDCMRLGEPWFYAACTGFNDSVKGTFQVGGRMTWLEDSELMIGSVPVPAYHVFEERTIIDTNDTGTHGTLDPTHELGDLGQTMHWWLSQEDGTILRYERKIRMSTPVVEPIVACTDYWEYGAFELTQYDPTPLAPSPPSDDCGIDCPCIPLSSSGSTGGNLPNPCGG